MTAMIAASLLLFPLLNLGYFPRTDAGQFVMNVKLPSGTRIGVTEQEVAKLEALVRQVIPAEDLDMILSNIGSTADYSAMYTSNSAMHTATVQVSLKEGHKVSSFAYIDRVRTRMQKEIPEMAAYFQSGSLVDAVLGLGMAAPIDVQVAGSNQATAFALASDLARKIRLRPDVGD